MERKLAALLLLFALATRCAYADDFGPGSDIRELRFVAPRLLAHSLRRRGGDPKNLVISDVVVVKNAAILSWDDTARHGFMGLVRMGSRWWDALNIERIRDYWGAATCAYPLKGEMAPSAPTPNALLTYGMPTDLVDQASHNADVRAATAVRSGQIASSRLFLQCDQPSLDSERQIEPAGGSFYMPRPYEITIFYTSNTSTPHAASSEMYARPPTDAEFLPYPTPMQYVPNAVAYFDLTINGTSPVTFTPGTAIDVWFPFVLDDRLNYDLTIGYADKPIGPIYARAFGNALHFVLPAFTVTPGRALMAEIDGNWH